jgi:hypothetical protein
VIVRFEGEPDGQHVSFVQSVKESNNGPTTP